MSHTTTIRGMNITSVPAMRHAVEALQNKGIRCELLENAKPRMYYRRQEETCDFVLKLHDSTYDVGFRKNADGGYDPVLDTWDNQIEDQVGAVCPVPDMNTSQGRAQMAIGRFMVEYNEALGLMEAVKNGLMHEGTYVDEKGNRHIVLQEMT